MKKQKKYVKAQSLKAKAEDKKIDKYITLGIKGDVATRYMARHREY